MDIKKECYELTLTQNYVSNWTLNDAIRELIQNGIDQEAIDKENKFTMEYDYVNKKLIFTNIKSKLSINTLLLGRSSKTNNEDTIGKFGEGYKIAALVINRLGKTFTIYNNEKSEIWESNFKNSEKWKEKILAFYIHKEETENKGLVIEVGNITKKEYYDTEEVWIGEDNYEKAQTEYGEIILDEEYEGKVFVNGITVGCNSDLKYGYNFKPKYIQLERDRKTCDSWNIEDITSKMIAEAMVNGDITIETVQKMVEENVDDVYHLEFNGYQDNVKEVKKLLIEAFDKQNSIPYSIPVSSQEEINKVILYGGNPVVVPSKVASLLKKEISERIQNLATLPLVVLTSPKDELKRWYDIYSKLLNEDAKKDFNLLLEKLYGKESL